MSPWRRICLRCGGWVRVLPGLHAKTVICIGPDACDPCCAECGTPLVLRDGDYDGDCDHQPAISGQFLEMYNRRFWF